MPAFYCQGCAIKYGVMQVDRVIGCRGVAERQAFGGKREAGVASLIAGRDDGGRAGGAEAASLLRRVGQILLAADPSWRLRHLSPSGDEADAPHRIGIKRTLDELCGAATVPALLAVSAVVHETSRGPALVTAGEYAAYPDDATLPLSWIGARIAERLVEGEGPLVVALSLHPAAGQPRTENDALRWLEALGLASDRALIIVDAPAHGDPLLAALADGLLGHSLDPETGTITMGRLASSLHERLASAVLGEASRFSAGSSTFCLAPSLARRLELEWPLPAAHAQGADAAEDDLIGATLPGGVSVDAVIARSRASVVYRGRQLAVGRSVAIKVLHRDVGADPESRRLFVHEIQAVGRIDHANVVRIHQADVTHDGRLFFVMELLAGSDLQTLLDAGSLPAERAIALMRQLLSGLAAVHEAGLVHADLKPANAVLVPRGEGGDRLVLIDFGLSRLRPVEASEQGVRSAGGTPAFMAPEQLRRGRVDARSDVFSAGLVLVALLTRWRRRSRAELVPPLGELPAALLAPLSRALALDPDERFASAAAMAAALDGEPAGPRPNDQALDRPNDQALDRPLDRTFDRPPAPPPFRRLAAFTEADREHFFGRDRELEHLVGHAIYRRLVLVTAPSGTGKTSLLRGGLLPRLEALGADPHYRSCRAHPTKWMEELSAPVQGRRVLIIDQLEEIDDDREVSGNPLAPLLALAQPGAWPAGLSVVLSVREDHLARLLARLQPLEDLALIRLRPLTRAGASEAIVRPLADHRLEMSPELLARLLDDLEAATSALGPELGWGKQAGIYPPHLQLACAVLYEALSPGEATLTLDHYQRLGGLEAIVGEHLDSVLENELVGEEAKIARDLFLALVTAGQARAPRREAELLSAVGAVHGEARVAAVLEVLRSQGLLVRAHRDGDGLMWELIHDCLVPRVLGWIDRRDLARRQVIEQLRHHLRRSRPALPSLLSRAELRELRAHPGAVDTLEEEWRRRALEAGAWTPSRLVARSRQVARRTAIATLSISGLVVIALAAAALDRWQASLQATRDRALRDRDQGRFVLELAPFEWSEETLTASPALLAAMPELRWTMHAPHPQDRGRPGPALADSYVSRGEAKLVEAGRIRTQAVEAPGGAAFLVVEGRGASGQGCAASAVPLRLPGYARRAGAPAVLRIPVPTCRASLAGMIRIPAGPYLRGGAGVPPSQKRAQDVTLSQVRRVALPSYRIDRTELTNAAIAPLVAIASITGIPAPIYVTTVELEGTANPPMPATNLNWEMARAYCAFWGKRLPTSEEWEKAFRGGVQLPDGRDNPVPLRTTAWGTAEIVGLANIYLADRPPRIARAGGYASDRTPYGVLDMTGNAMEWLASDGSAVASAVRGGSWGQTTPENFADYTASDNPRPPDARDYTYGARCAQD
jgi:eukaryotic-like serine/threonine-protein kinase